MINPQSAIRNPQSAIAALAAVVCYVGTVPNDYCYDDHAVVQWNKTVNEPGQWLAIWTTDYWSEAKQAAPDRDLLYRPVAMTSHRLIRTIAGPTPLGHHVANVLLHALISAMVAWLCRLMGGSARAALAAGVLFAVLPIHTEPVAAVVGLADLLATMGVLLAVLCHRRWLLAVAPVSVCGIGLASQLAGPASHPALTRDGDRLESRSHRRPAIWAALAAVAALGAMGAKESGISVVLIVPLFDAFWTGRHGSVLDTSPRASPVVASRRSRRGGTRRVKEKPLPRASVGQASQPVGNNGRVAVTGWKAGPTHRLGYLLIPLAVYLALRYNALGEHFYQKPALTKTINVLVDAPLWQHALGCVQLWGMYWAKTMWPAVLSVSYSINAIRLATSPIDGHVVVGALAAFGLGIASIVAWRRGHRCVVVLALATLVSYAPTANALVLMRVFFAERIWYLPSVWVALLAGFGAAQLGRRRAWYLVAVMIVGAMTLRCWIRGAEWRDDGTLLAAAYRDLPEAVTVQHRYGQWLANHGQYERGVELMQRALDVDPGYADAHRSLGAAHLEARDYQRALEHWRIADMYVPNHPPTARALAFLRGALADEHQAELLELRRRVADHPEDVAAELALLRKLREFAYTDEALARLQARERQLSDHAAWQLEYAVTLVYLDRRDEAIDRYRTSLGLDPQNPQSTIELAMLLFERRDGDDLDEAQTLVDRASKLAPGAPSVLACRAELLALRGDVTGAVRLYQDAIRALPPGSGQRRLFEERAKTLGQ